MELAHTCTWHIEFDEDTERQLIYHTDRPSFKYPHTLKTVDGKIVDMVGKPEWTPICIELPTRVLPETSQWLESKIERDIKIICSNISGVTLETINLYKTRVVSTATRKARSINNIVISVILKYDHANWSK